MNDATPLTPLAHERNSIFKCKQHTHTCTLHDPRGPEKYSQVPFYALRYFPFINCIRNNYILEHNNA